VQTGSVEGEVVAGRYRLGGRRGMGTVWRAEDELLQRAVAIKEICIPGGLPAVEVERLRRRYLREARAAARLRHENAVVVHDVIPETSRVWIVMELFDTPDLAALVRSDGPLEPVAAARIGLQLLDALAAAHQAGVLHRDVKPANVLICENGRAVLTDFGVASVTGDASLTATGQLIGSPAYLAPERLTGGVVGPASDLWALGCTLYAAVEGASPFWRDEPFAILSAITVEALSPPQAAGPLIPVILGLLEKDQAQRWDTARTRAALERVIAGQAVEEKPAWGAPAAPASAAEPPAAEPEPAPVAGDEPDGPAPPEVPVPVPRRGGRRIAVALLVILALLGVTGGVAEYLFQPFGLNVGILRAQADSDPGGPSEASAGPLTLTHPDAGYTITVPAGWVQSNADDALWRFSRADELAAPRTSTMNIYVETRPAGGKSSLDLSRAYDTKLAGDARNFPGYERVALQPKVFGEYRGAMLEFSYNNPNSGPRHVVVFRTVFRNISYEISLNGPADQFKSARQVFTDLATSLRLPE